MKLPRKALIIASTAEEAATLGSVVDAGGDTWRPAATLDEADALLSAGSFDFALIAVRIAAHDGGPVHLTTGVTALELLRERHPRRTEAGDHVFPILMVSPHEETVAVVSRAHQRGVDSFVVVKSEADAVALGDEIRHLVALSGQQARVSPRPAPIAAVAAPASPIAAAPVDPTPQPPTPSAGPPSSTTATPPGVPSESIRLRIRVTARKSAKRTVLHFNGREVTLPDSLFLALLTVVAGSAAPDGPWIDRYESGIAAAASSRIGTFTAGALPPGLVLFETDGFGRVRLNSAVAVDPVPWRALTRHSNLEVRALAEAQAGA